MDSKRIEILIKTYKDGKRETLVFNGVDDFQNNFSIKKAELCRSAYFPKEDSNPHDQNQNLRCYHYTIGECNVRKNYHIT